MSKYYGSMAKVVERWAGRQGGKSAWGDGRTLFTTRRWRQSNVFLDRCIVVAGPWRPNRGGSVLGGPRGGHWRGPARSSRPSVPRHHSQRRNGTGGRRGVRVAWAQLKNLSVGVAGRAGFRRLGVRSRRFSAHTRNEIHLSDPRTPGTSRVTICRLAPAKIIPRSWLSTSYDGVQLQRRVAWRNGIPCCFMDEIDFLLTKRIWLSNVQ